MAGDKESGGGGGEGEDGDGGDAFGHGYVQMVGERGGTEDEARPGQGAAPDVGMKPGGDGPPFQVFDLDGGVEFDPVAGAAEAVSEGDVFNARPDVALVEASHAEEDFAADGSAAGPESGSVFARLLVHEVVQEVFVLGDEARAVRFVVVGTDQGVEGGVAGEPGVDAAEGAGMDTDIGVDEDNQGAFGESGAPVSRGGGAHAARRAKEGNAVLAGDGRGIIGRAVVDDDTLARLERGVLQGLETTGERQCIVENGDDNTYLQSASLSRNTGLGNEKRVLAVPGRF